MATFDYPPYVAHPWHGISPGDGAPGIVEAFIEIVPTDTVKYEVDKRSGHLRIDRPQRYSSLCPTLYGFIPQTYCGAKVAELAAAASQKPVSDGDGDPLDICVLTEAAIPRGSVVLSARPVGGLRLIDREQADDKIIAVLEGDAVYGQLTDINDCPAALIDRLRHYFLSYKQLPGMPSVIQLAGTYGAPEARAVIEASLADYLTLLASP